MSVLFLVLSTKLSPLKTPINIYIINNIRHQQKHCYGNQWLEINYFKYTTILKDKVHM